MFLSLSYDSAAPGASVLASAPAATLDPELAGFETRFHSDRKRDFSRYGDAPGLIGTARDVVILFDPTDAVSCAHAGQFRGPQVTRAPLRFTGPAPHRLIRAGGLLVPLLRALANGRLTRARVAEAIRPVRRTEADHLWRLVQIARSKGQVARALRLAELGLDVTGDLRFTEPASARAS